MLNNGAAHTSFPPSQIQIHLGVRKNTEQEFADSRDGPLSMRTGVPAQRIIFKSRPKIYSQHQAQKAQ
jgi:hypothetical protein